MIQAVTKLYPRSLEVTIDRSKMVTLNHHRQKGQEVDLCFSSTSIRFCWRGNEVDRSTTRS